MSYFVTPYAYYFSDKPKKVEIGGIESAWGN
jgi:hypothetical protein